MPETKSASSRAERMKDEAYRQKVAESQRSWREANPEKVEAAMEDSIEKRRKRVQEDPEYAEKIRAASRAAMAERAKRAANGAEYKLVVRMKGEKRAKPVLRIVYTEEGGIRGLKRGAGTRETPVSFGDRAQVEALASTLMEQFPTKIEAAYPSVI